MTRKELTDEERKKRRNWGGKRNNQTGRPTKTPGERATVLISYRITPTEAQRLEALADEDRGENINKVARKLATKENPLTLHWQATNKISGATAILDGENEEAALYDTEDPNVWDVQPVQPTIKKHCPRCGDLLSSDWLAMAGDELQKAGALDSVRSAAVVNVWCEDCAPPGELEPFWSISFLRSNNAK